MSQQSHIYVIAFDSGTLKVGRAADVVARLGTHRREAARHGVCVAAQWCSAPCSESEAVLYERQLVALCASRGTLRAGTEYFIGVDFDEVQSHAEALAGAPGPLPAKKQRPARSKGAATPTSRAPSGYRPPYWKDGVEYIDEADEFSDDLCPLVPGPAPWPPRTPEQLERLRRNMVDEKYEL